ncbi:uncharacterized protein RMCFA_1676, partial [Mycolicibacterium fortuitum subsp. acetamidolyticum]
RTADPGHIVRTADPGPIVRTADGEVRQDFRIAPDLPTGLQRELAVDREVVHEGSCRTQATQPGLLGPRPVHHHIGAVLQVRPQVTVDVAHQHQHDDGAARSKPIHAQAAVVDHALRGIGIHREHRHVLFGGTDLHRHRQHGAEDGVLRGPRIGSAVTHAINLEPRVDRLQESVYSGQ